MKSLNRRTFLATSALLPLSARLTGADAAPQPASTARASGPVVISSGNGLPAVERAMALLKEGADAVDAVVQGVTLVENDPDDMSVGYGGLPNEDGVVQLDASVMHGPSHKAGAVAALENIKNPAQVALKVLRHTNHVLLVGPGALEFAKAQGFPEENLLTERAREAWLKWKMKLNEHDDWLDPEQQADTDLRAALAKEAGVPFTHGTIHCSAIDTQGNVSACTTTSGLSYKIPGRVGDSPIVGAGMFVDNAVGAAGATGVGEEVIHSCASFQIVQHMAAGDEPQVACLKTLRWIADHTKRNRRLNERGEPNFGETFYALRRDGAFGGASFRPGAHLAVHDGTSARKEPCAALYDG